MQQKPTQRESPPPAITVKATPGAPPKVDSVAYNPFDDFLQPSESPAFWSNPGLISGASLDEENVEAAIAPFPAFFSANSLASTTSMATRAATTMQAPPSHAPVFFSDPPPQWRRNG